MERHSSQLDFQRRVSEEESSSELQEEAAIPSAKDRPFSTRNKDETRGRRGMRELECVGILENI